jgi:hypothetical protein
MSRWPIRDLITPKPQPTLTPSLVPAFRNNAAEMVETYIFTDTIRAHFEEIFDAVARGHGQGFWVQAEYGAGKTHFLVTLAALLANSDDSLWRSVRDDSVRHARQRLSATQLFPVVLSLRGEAAGDITIERTLMDVLLESGFKSALEAAGLQDQVRTTAAEDIVAWLHEKTSPAIRSDAAAFVQQRTGQTPEAYRSDEGVDALAELLTEYFMHAGVKPDIDASVKSRLSHIYRQITNPRGPAYGGILVVIDEYEGWAKNHNSPEELSRDAELLETLGFLLPHDEGLQIYTVVASQSSVPAKLQGSQEGDRFINIPLLAQNNERDYDVIIARRARGLDPDHIPEIKDHFDFYRQHFAFARNLTETEFYDYFPFQPRCFESIRRITTRDLPTARSGLLVFWQTINHRDLIARSSLIRLADMIRSEHLEKDCLSKSVYRDSYTAYRAAFDALPDLDLEEGDLPLARDILTTLYLWYLAYLEQPRKISLHDLTEATLTTSDFLRADDKITLALDSMKALRQIEFDGKVAGFVPAGGDSFEPRVIFNERKRQALRDRFRIQSAWSRSLFWTPSETGGVSGIFHEFAPDAFKAYRVQSRNLEYSGEALVGSWRLDHGLPLPRSDVHFRVIILTPDAAQSVKASDLQDPRIAVILPEEMSDEIRDAAAAYEAWTDLQEEHRAQAGREAEAMRFWLDNNRLKIFSDLAATQLKLYQSGRIVTRDNLGISPRDAFGRGGGTEQRIASIVDSVLQTIYRDLPIDPNQLRDVLTPAEARKVFEGYFNSQARTAEKAALRSYGVGLGLSHRDAPERFDPQSPPVFAMIEELLAARAGGDLPIWQIYDRLSGGTIGLPYIAIQLYLLAFVRRGQPRVDLQLKARHNLRTRNAQPLNRDRLTASSVVDLEWKSGLDEKFDALVPSSGPVWNDVLAYAREIVDGLRTTTNQVEIEQQSLRLGEELKRLREEVGARQRTLDILANTLSASLPPAATETLQKLNQLTTSPIDGYTEFYEQAEAVFAGRPDTLRACMQMYARLGDLAAVTADVGFVKRYLDDVELRSADSALSADRMTLQAQIALDGLIGTPGLWPRLRGDFDQFAGRYRNEYRKHHRDYYLALESLRESLAGASARLESLALLNRIEGIGAPAGADLERRYRDLDQRLAPCPVREVAAVSVEARPTCQSCGLRLTTTPPEVDIRALLRELDEALAQKRRQLAGETVARVLRGAERPDLRTFLEAVSAADQAALVEVMTPELVDFINRLLAEEEIHIADAPVLQELARRYPSVEERDIPNLLADFEARLREAFSRARQSGKKNVRINLK